MNPTKTPSLIDRIASKRKERNDLIKSKAKEYLIAQVEKNIEELQTLLTQQRRKA